MNKMCFLFVFICLSNAILPEKKKLVKELLGKHNEQIDSMVNRNKKLLTTLSEGALNGDPYPLYLKNVLNVEQARSNRFAKYLSTRKSHPFSFLKINHTPIRDKPSADPVNKICDYYHGQYNGQNGYLYKHHRTIQKEALRGFSETIVPTTNTQYAIPSLIKPIHENDGY